MSLILRIKVSYIIVCLIKLAKNNPKKINANILEIWEKVPASPVNPKTEAIIASRKNIIM